MPPSLIAAEIYRHSSYGPKHPLAVPRVSVALDLIRALGWLPAERYHTATPAPLDRLARFHTAEYLAALHRAEATQQVTEAERERHHLGKHGNPLYREMFSRPATSAGGTMLAAELTLPGGVVHHLAGGTHHGQPDRASGFCYLNDPVLGLLTWLDGGLDNLFYLDIDAHHGDGVEQAFRDDPRVFTLSIHEAGRWPHTGTAQDQGPSHRNLPMPAGMNDTEFAWAMHHVVLPLIRARQPQGILLQCGADALEEDPLARLSLSNNAHWAAVAALRGLAPRLLVVGGGGYNPWTVARCWAGVWGTLNNLAMPAHLPPPAEAVLRGIEARAARAAWRSPPEHWFTTLRDTPRPGTVRAEVIRVCNAALAG